MTTFDDLIVHRAPLAHSYLHLLAAQPGRPLALFAPRRVGKTIVGSAMSGHSNATGYHRSGLQMQKNPRQYRTRTL